LNKTKPEFRIGKKFSKGK